MQILIAPDSFKDCMSSYQVARQLAEGIRAVIPDAGITLFPIADGGEGTSECIRFHKGGSLHKVLVHDPLGRTIPAACLFVEKENLAVIEMATASGLELLNIHERDPMKTSSYGTGELIRYALEAGMNNMLLTIGGSATVDGGIGMAAAIGFRFYDDTNNILDPVGGNLTKIARIETAQIHQNLLKANIIIACDVLNTLNGDEGAARVFGPQKGANTMAVDMLAKGLKNLSDVVLKDTGFDADKHPGTGAAGGLALLLLAYANAKIQRGFDTIAEITCLEQAINKHAVIITGEGKIDQQTKYGKVVSGIAKLSRQTTSSLLFGVFGKIDRNKTLIKEQYHMFEAYEILAMAKDQADSIEGAANYLRTIGTKIASSLHNTC